jgi:hypothetical protein
MLLREPSCALRLAQTLFPAPHRSSQISVPHMYQPISSVNIAPFFVLYRREIELMGGVYLSVSQTWEDYLDRPPPPAPSTCDFIYNRQRPPLYYGGQKQKYVLFDPLHRCSLFIGRQRCQSIQSGGGGLDTILISMISMECTILDRSINPVAKLKRLGAPGKWKFLSGPMTRSQFAIRSKWNN